MTETSFLRGYGQWLVQQRWWILGVVLVALLGFLAALWLTSTPQDAFTYEIF